MRAYAVPLTAVIVIAGVAGFTGYRDYKSSVEGEQVVHGFPSDLEAEETGPVVRRNGAYGPAPKFKAARSAEAQQASVEDPFDATPPEGAPPAWLRTIFDVLASLGLFGEPEPRDDVDRSGFETARGRTTPGHDFSTPDISASGYRAQTPSYPSATDGSRSIRARASAPAPRGFSD